MTKRQVLILWITALVLIGLYTVVKVGQSKGTLSQTRLSSGQLLLENFPANDISRIVVTSADGTTTLVRNADKKWAVQERDGYPAKNAIINEILAKLAELKVVEGVEASPALAPRFGMDEASTSAKDHGVTLQFANASGNEVARITLGKTFGGNQDEEEDPMAGPVSSGTGRFIRNHADDSGVYKVSERFLSLVTNPKDWLAPEFFNVEKPKSITVTQPGKDDVAWKLTRKDENDNFALEGAPGEGLDEATTIALKNLFSYGEFTDVATKDTLTKRDQPDKKQKITIDTVEGFHYDIAISPAKPGEAKPGGPAPAADNYFLTVTVSGEVPKERKKEAEEKPEDAKSKDEAFAARSKALQEQLETEKKLAGRTFEVPKTFVDAALKSRDALLKKNAPAPAQPGNAGIPRGPGPMRIPAEAVTPPVEIPNGN